MDKILCEPGHMRQFLEQVQTRLGLGADDLAAVLGISGRTIRDWRREKYKPPKKSIEILSKLSGLAIPNHTLLPDHWNNKYAASLGGKRRHLLHGLLGTKESRVKGGRISWERRKKSPELLKKYQNTFNKPTRSADLAELVGVLLGDGGLTINQCIVYLNADTDVEYAIYVKKLILKLFGLTPNILPHRVHRVLRVSISGVNLIEYLTSIGLKVGNKVKLQVGVPVWINTNPHYISKCIRGLIDTDGCFVKHRYKVNGKLYQYYKIAFTNRSIPVLNFVFEGLGKLGFNPKRSYKYQVWLHGQEEVKRYLREIGTSNYKPVVKELLGGVA